MKAAVKRHPLRHLVALKFKRAATRKQIKTVEAAFRELKARIPEVVSLEAGTNISPEKLDKGFTHAFILTFNNARDRDAYLVHAEHQKFVTLALPVIEDVLVIDYLARS